MFRIGVLEATLTCALVALAILIPLIVSRAQSRMEKRLDDIEHKLGKKQ